MRAGPLLSAVNALERRGYGASVGSWVLPRGMTDQGKVGIVGSVPPGMASGCRVVTSSVTVSDWE